MLEPHDPAWVDRASEMVVAVGSTLEALRGSATVQVHHIGSTAVPGLPAKPFLDLQATLLPLPDDTLLVEALGPLGLRREPGARPDSPGVHRDRPLWQSDAPAAVWQKSLFTTSDHSSPGAVILHVRRSDSPWAQWAVAFRDWLRTHAEERDRYAAIKRQLMEANAGKADFDDYTRAKSVYFDEVEPVVRAWARQNGAGC